MNWGTRNMIDSTKQIFQPATAEEINPAAKFASINDLLDNAPNYTPEIEDTLNKSIDSVKQFIKTASQLFGKISYSMESV